MVKRIIPHSLYPVEIVGAKPGEKHDEKLLNDNES